MVLKTYLYKTNCSLKCWLGWVIVIISLKSADKIWLSIIPATLIIVILFGAPFSVNRTHHSRWVCKYLKPPTCGDSVNSWQLGTEHPATLLTSTATTTTTPMSWKSQSLLDQNRCFFPEQHAYDDDHVIVTNRVVTPQGVNSGQRGQGRDWTGDVDYWVGADSGLGATGISTLSSLHSAMCNNTPSE